MERSVASRRWIVPAILPIVLAPLLSLGVGCSSGPKPATETAPPPMAEEEAQDQAKTAAQDRERRYRLQNEGEADAKDVEFQEDDAPVAPEEAKGGTWDNPKPESSDAGSDLVVEGSGARPIPRSTPELPLPPSARPKVTRGFRVQIFAGRDRVDAEDVARIARTRLEDEIYVEFETGLYKVRAGDFLDRGAALRLRDRAREYGYGEAWVVTTTVKGERRSASP